jgi:hypothetical protein
MPEHVQCPPLVALSTGQPGLLLAWERHELDGTWWAIVVWIRTTGETPRRQVVNVSARSIRPLEPRDAYRHVPRWIRGRDGTVRRSRPAAMGDHEITP